MGEGELFKFQKIISTRIKKFYQRKLTKIETLLQRQHKPNEPKAVQHKTDQSMVRDQCSQKFLKLFFIGLYKFFEASDHICIGYLLDSARNGSDPSPKKRDNGKEV